jgi:hypothetical protein
MSAAEKSSRGPTQSVRGFADFVFGMFTRNLVSKIAALFLAVLIWITVRQDLTRTAEFDTLVIFDLSPDLMLLEDAPDSVTVEFEGPTSRIEQLRRAPEPPEIVLQITRQELGDQLIATRTFNADRGNINHNYGEEISISRVIEGNITVTVAVKDVQRKPVARPTATGLPPEWEIRIDLLKPDVRLVGPKAVLDDLTEVPVLPVAVDRMLEGLEEDELTIEYELEISDNLKAERVGLSGGERISCRITLTRSLTPKELDIPFSVLLEDPDWPVTMEVHETDLVKKLEDGSFVIHLTFTGSPRDLARVEEALAAKRVRAYVHAMKLQV